MDWWCCDEAAAPGLASDEPVLGQLLHRVTGRHPADVELVDQFRVRRHPCPGLERRDARPQRTLDLAVVRLVADLGHDAVAPAASAPWIAAPIAPAHVPSSAVTSSTSSRDVV